MAEIAKRGHYYESDASAQRQVQNEHDEAPLQRAQYPTWRVLRRGRTWLIVYLVAVLALLALALAAHTYSVLPGDLPFTHELQESRSPIVFGYLYGVSYIGFPLQSSIIVAAVVALFLALRLWLEALFLALTLLADGLGGLLKVAIGRQRPASNLVHVVQVIHSPSFPSGHTLHYTVFFGFLAFLLAIHFRPSWWRNLLIGICALLILSVGPSRVYLGEHWLTDVLGGYLLGALFLMPFIAVYLRVLTQRREWLARKST